MGKMEEFTKFNNQTAGRDKVIRLVQYTSRIVWYTLAKQRSCVKSAEKAKRLDEYLGLMRRVLRFGRFFETLHSALPVLTSVSDPVIRMTSVLSRISSSCFMLIDHIVCLDKLGVLPPKFIDASKWDKTSARFWLYSILLGLIRDFYEIRRIYKEEFLLLKSRRLMKYVRMGGSTQSAQLSEDKMDERDSKNGVIVGECIEQVKVMSKCVRDHGDVAVDTLKNACDLFLPLNTLGFVNLSPALVGLLAIISTIASTLPQINPMIKMVPAT